MNEKLLMTVENSIELFLYEGILKQNNIPYIVKQTSMNRYMKILGGSASYSVPAEIFVNEENYDKAIEMTEVIRAEKNEAPDNKENPQYRLKRILAWIIVGTFAVVILFMLISVFFMK